jgi:hypothetical protein
MTTWRRRDILKSGLAAGVSLLAARAVHALANGSATLTPDDAPRGAPRLAPLRERLCIDRGGRFRLGHDATRVARTPVILGCAKVEEDAT